MEMSRLSADLKDRLETMEMEVVEERDVVFLMKYNETYQELLLNTLNRNAQKIGIDIQTLDSVFSTIEKQNIGLDLYEKCRLLDSMQTQELVECYAKLPAETKPPLSEQRKALELMESSELESQYEIYQQILINIELEHIDEYPKIDIYFLILEDMRQDILIKMTTLRGKINKMGKYKEAENSKKILYEIFSKISDSASLIMPNIPIKDGEVCFNFIRRDSLDVEKILGKIFKKIAPEYDIKIKTKKSTEYQIANITVPEKLLHDERTISGIAGVMDVYEDVFKKEVSAESPSLQSETSGKSPLLRGIKI